jgi:GNAT superfamily N-acetyltransferase
MPDKKIEYRRANHKDFKSICDFVDFWLSGRARSLGIKKAGNDYFVTRRQQRAYLKNCYVWLALENNKVVGWAVKQRNNVMIHLLISAEHRGLGIGSKLLEIMNPDIIRSKSDQMTGDPAGFYEKYGYMKIAPNTLLGKKKNIDLMVKRTRNETHSPAS